MSDQQYMTLKGIDFCSVKDRNIYQYYRDLISFRQKGDPAVMLRCINPTEAKLIDAAAGIHVKFRLAGVSRPDMMMMMINYMFPQVIY